jgi:hypothetical protein
MSGEGKYYSRIRVYVEGYHYWPDAPADVCFLRNKHRHVFIIDVCVESGPNRNVEFFTFSNVVKRIINKGYNVCSDGSIDFGEDSCETIARYIYEKLSEMGFKVKRVEVSEDGFNAGCYGYV